MEEGSSKHLDGQEGVEGGTALTNEEKGKGKAKDEDEAKETALDRFNCHIWCALPFPFPLLGAKEPRGDSLDLPSQPVVTPCGHMYCWPCMHEVRLVLLPPFPSLFSSLLTLASVARSGLLSRRDEHVRSARRS